MQGVGAGPGPSQQPVTPAVESGRSACALFFIQHSLPVKVAATQPGVPWHAAQQAASVAAGTLGSGPVVPTSKSRLGTKVHTVAARDEEDEDVCTPRADEPRERAFGGVARGCRPRVELFGKPQRASTPLAQPPLGQLGQGGRLGSASATVDMTNEA